MSNRLLTLALLAAVISPHARVHAQESGTILLSKWTEVKWRSDYHAARKEAQEKNLPLLIDFGTPGCFWCRKMDESTFRDPRIMALMNERYIPLKIDAEREVHLANVLNIESYPTFVAAAPDGRIVDLAFRGRPLRAEERPYLKGFQEADAFHEILQKLSGSLQAPDWMQHELQLALQKMQQGEYGVAITALRGILNDAKGRPIHGHAQKYLDAIEQKAMERVVQARDMQDKGNTAEAIAHLSDTIRYFPTLEASRQANDLMVRLKDQTSTEKSTAQRSQRARELLAQAREFYKQRDIIPCLERCASLMRDYVDLPEGQDAMLLMSDLKANPALLQQAADSLSERLGDVYLALAESHLAKGQPQRAEYFFQRVVLACPGTRHAESAQVRLVQLQGIRMRNGPGITSAGNPE